jgi:tRNA 2-selenouridine synthase
MNPDGLSDPAAAPPAAEHCVELLRNATPLIDLRAPVEFARGSLPSAVNLPILDDEQRAAVGTTYRESGQAAAISLGHELLSGERKEQRIAAWRNFIVRHEDAQLFCWRGGLRSETAQSWLRESGLEVPRVAGGYKRLRNTALAVLACAPQSKRWIVVGGRTGSGKTDLLQRTAFAIDLEGLANHRGSAFGARETPQPEPANFENQLAASWLQHDHNLLLLEDESRTIGRLAVPEVWHQQMQRAELILLEADMSLRCENIAREYVLEPLEGGIEAGELFSRFQSALDRIRKRLGGLRHQQISALLKQAFADGEHQRWIEALLSGYYDPMYDYQLAKKQQRVTLTGSAGELLDYLQQQAANADQPR